MKITADVKVAAIQKLWGDKVPEVQWFDCPNQPRVVEATARIAALALYNKPVPQHAIRLHQASPCNKHRLLMVKGADKLGAEGLMIGGSLCPLYMVDATGHTDPRRLGFKTWTPETKLAAIELTYGKGEVPYAQSFYLGNDSKGILRGSPSAWDGIRAAAEALYAPAPLDYILHTTSDRIELTLRGLGRVIPRLIVGPTDYPLFQVDPTDPDREDMILEFED